MRSAQTIVVCCGRWSEAHPDFARPHLGVLISERSIGAGSLGGFSPDYFTPVAHVDSFAVLPSKRFLKTFRFR